MLQKYTLCLARKILPYDSNIVQEKLFPNFFKKRCLYANYGLDFN